MILPIYLTSTIDAGLGGRSLTTVFSRVGQVPADLVQARFVQAGLHAAHNGVGRALGAAHDAAPYRPRRHRTARAIRSAMEGCTPDRTSFAASQSRTIAPSLLGPLKSATLMWSPLVAQPIGWATATFPYQRHAKPSGSSPPMQKLGKSTTLGVASLEYAGEWSMGSRQMLLVFCRRAAPAP